MDYLGNTDLLNLPKTAFLASSKIPVDLVLRCYDWATQTSQSEQCVISGFSSRMEQDILHFLLKAKCPVIMVLARRMYRDLPEKLKEPLTQGRLLIISVSSAIRQSKATAFARNRFICEQANTIHFIGVTKQSSLYLLKNLFEDKTASSI
ncbi:MAG: hypothetical protein K6F20_12685 [Bacteroidaceae bacterium]|nr:hypothetical protein [Bacteroidaceae bacterium]